MVGSSRPEETRQLKVRVYLSGARAVSLEIVQLLNVLGKIV